jgi:hypothetical protein
MGFEMLAFRICNRKNGRALECESVAKFKPVRQQWPSDDSRQFWFLSGSPGQHRISPIGDSSLALTPYFTGATDPNDRADIVLDSINVNSGWSIYLVPGTRPCFFLFDIINPNNTRMCRGPRITMVFRCRSPTTLRMERVSNGSSCRRRLIPPVWRYEH